MAEMRSSAAWPGRALWTGLALSALGGCSGPAEERPLVGEEHGAPIVVEVYTSVGDCVRAGRLSLPQCRDGLRQAMRKHPAFAEKWNGPELCREIHVGADCSPVTIEGGARYWAARPVAFLACFPQDGQCRTLTFAPVYHSASFGDYTGSEGGSIERPSLAFEASDRPARREVGQRVRRYPAI